MMTLFVVNSCADAKDYPETVDSFGSMVAEVHRVASLDEINGYDRAGDWYGVIYDDELIDDRLKEGLKVFLKETKVDVLVLFKKINEDKASLSPRIFRRHITLKDGSLLPEQKNIKFETVLNGWVCEI